MLAFISLVWTRLYVLHHPWPMCYIISDYLKLHPVLQPPNFSIAHSPPRHFHQHGNSSATALFKSGDQFIASNCRPITILPTISKVLERAVHCQVYRYLIDNKILTPRQFGFIPNSSHFTNTTLSNMDKELVTGTVFPDLTKAFDTVDHVLLEKIVPSGFSFFSVGVP